MRAYYPDTPRTTGHGIVLLNHIGSSSYTDSGRDAQALTDCFALPTIAVDRPGSAFDFRRRPGKRLEQQHLREYSELGKKVLRLLQSEGITEVLVTGRSAGASGALALTRTESLPVASVAAFEPVGVEQLDVKTGKQLYRRYMRHQTYRLTHEDGIVKPQPPGLPLGQSLARLALMAPHYLNDVRQNQDLWATSFALDDAAYIAEHMPEVRGSITFADDSLTAYKKSVFQSLESLRESRSSLPNAKPFDINIEPNTVHASFDRRSCMHQMLIPLVKEMLSQ